MVGTIEEERVNKVAFLGMLGLVSAALIGCSDPDPPTTTVRPPVLFPNEVGYLWTYQYQDAITDDQGSIHFIYDTVDVVVIRDTVLSGGEEAKIWVYRYQNRPIPDTQYVATVADTIKMYRTSEPFLVTLLVPFVSGAEWTSGGGRIDTTTVSGPIPFRVQNISYDDTYWIKRNWSGNDQSEASDIFVVPDVGIILMWFDFSDPTMNPPQISRTWELIDYDFTP